MKKIFFAAGIGVAAIAAAACSGGGGGGGGITNGTYNFTTGSATPNTCGGANYYNATDIPSAIVSNVTATSFDVAEGSFSTTYTRSGSNIHDDINSRITDFDFTDPVVAVSNNGFSRTYNCKIHRVEDFGGTTSGSTLNFVDDYDYQVTSGTECGAVATTAGFPVLPCQDKFLGSYKK